MPGVWYTTREDVKDALDVRGTLRSDSQIDRCVADASLSVEATCNRVFYPTVATRYFDFPSYQYARPWRVWLDANELAAVPTSVVTGGTSIPLSAVYVEPANYGPPYTHLELRLDSLFSFVGGPSYQRNIAITGIFGYGLDTAPAGALATSVGTTSITSVTVTDSASIGVGHLITVDSERMIVTEKSMVTSGQTLQVAVTAATTDTVIAVTTGSAFSRGEILLLDAERMKIVDIAGNNLIVKRAWDGTVLAAHAGSTIYVPRALTVTRGALGATAATHSSSATIAKHVYPAGVQGLAVAEALNMLLQETSGYARTIGAGDNVRNASGAGLADKRAMAADQHGRTARTRAV